MPFRSDRSRWEPIQEVLIIDGVLWLQCDRARAIEQGAAAAAAAAATMSVSLLSILLLALAGIFCHSKSFHGGTFLAMAGKDSVVIASDSRFTSQEEITGPYLVGEHQRMAFRVG